MMTVIEYVTEEVRRQGHDTFDVNGIERVGWMLDGWSYALTCYLGGNTRPSIADIHHIGQLIERVKNKRGFRECGVYVGSCECPEPEEVPKLLNALWKQKALTPMTFYKEFEEIHPFVDGNGRTGKILLNWLNGTLHDPIFPPADLFGHPILNP